MSGKSRVASSEVTLGDDGLARLAGYSGRLEIITRRRQSWWRRLLRRPQRFGRQVVYGNIGNGKARVWKRV